MVSLQCFLGNGNVSKTLTGMVKWLRKAEAEGFSDARALVPSWISRVSWVVLLFCRSRGVTNCPLLRNRFERVVMMLLRRPARGGYLVSIGSLRLLVVSMIMVLSFVRLLRLLSFALKIFSCDWRKWIPS